MENSGTSTTASCHKDPELAGEVSERKEQHIYKYFFNPAVCSFIIIHSHKWIHYVIAVHPAKSQSYTLVGLHVILQLTDELVGNGKDRHED